MAELCEGINHGSVEAVAVARVIWRRGEMVYGEWMCQRCLALRLKRASLPPGEDLSLWTTGDPVDELTIRPIREARR